MKKVKRLTPTQELQDRVNYLLNENIKLNQQLNMQTKYIAIVDRMLNGPPTIMIACEKIVDAAAHQVSDALQMMKEGRR
jgi:hypothetical protein